MYKQIRSLLKNELTYSNISLAYKMKLKDEYVSVFFTFNCSVLSCFVLACLDFFPASI